ncbi:MAG: mannonate dehydratase [Actinomycetia bacterium]|nr:mannonate dehydratase [Actinomycetes bacterium]
MEIGLNLYPHIQNLPLGILKQGRLNHDNLSFARQLGVDSIIAWMPLGVGDGFWEFDDLLKLRKFIESYGLKLAAIENLPPLHYDRIMMGMKGRKEQIENLKRTIFNLGKAKINCLGYFFSIVGYWGHWRTGNCGGGRGRAHVTSFDYSLVKEAPPARKGMFWGNWKADYFNPSQSIGHISRKTMWERLSYMLEEIIPAAGEAGVKLCIHPADPPAPVLAGEERIMNCPRDFKQLIEKFPSPWHGIQFCQGTFAEMEGVGPKVIELIDYFGKGDRIAYVHFRNIRGSFPRYEETFIDDGDIDMVQAFKAYRQSGFEGMLIPDHVPVLKPHRCSWHAGMAHAVGYIRSLIDSFD